MHLATLHLDRKTTIGIILGLGMIILGYALGWKGLVGIVGILLLYVLPFYFILDYFELDFEENIILSFFLGLAYYSTLVYYLGFLVGSFRLSMALSYLILIGIGGLLHWKGKMIEGFIQKKLKLTKKKE